MKRGLLVVFILLLVPLAYAEEKVENFNGYDSVTINAFASSSIDVIKKGSSPLLAEMNAELFFVPFDTEQQDMLNIEINSNPKSVEAFDEEEVRYKWEETKADKLEFGYTARVRVDNTFPGVFSKIEFPIKNLDSGLIEYLKPGEKIVITNEISKKASEIIGNSKDLYEVVYKLAKWNNENIKYDLNSLTAKAVQDSQWVLDNREGVCDEMTNLFISMLRSQGVPARFISGLVYTNTLYDWGPHGWAEVYFPNVGWIPFDPTFGQYGYADIGHIKMKNSFDSIEPAIKYNWRSRDVDLEPAELDLKVSLLSKGNKVESPVSMELELLNKQVKFGSYVPLRVTLENTKGFYISPSIFITKGPGIEGDNLKSVLLEPNGKKDVYFILKVPQQDKGFTYNSNIEVEDVFGGKETTILEYGENFELYSLEAAEERVSRIEETGENGETSLVLFNCEAGANEYYEYEQGKFNCTLENDGSKKIENLEVCLGEDCKVLDLDVSEKNNLEFIKTGLSDSLYLVAKGSDFIKYSYPSFKLIKTPKVRIYDIKVTQPLRYDEIGNLTFLMSTDSTLFGAIIEVGKIGKLEVKEFEGTQQIILPFRAYQLKVGENEVEIKVKFKDKNGKEYENSEKFSVEIENVGFFKKFLIFFKRLFV
ncbi:MAG: transglutaminase domain-containing protein [Candidatus Woesearchaeota archaeon]|nr:MAG: transglutaminase domain-containing protein [Candidatus Woesearchaeota archaeon]